MAKLYSFEVKVKKDKLIYITRQIFVAGNDKEDALNKIKEFYGDTFVSYSSLGEIPEGIYIAY